MTQFHALIRDESSAKIITHDFWPTLRPNEILIKSHFSSINYKDALAVTGRGKILKSLPLTPGIDVAGEIVESTSNELKKGDLVLVTGCGLGEEFNGGYSEFVKVHKDHVIPIPKGLTPKQVMIYGTAGFTTALIAHRMLHNGQKPEMGPILVTGASGGVGQFAVSLFSKLGFEVWALSAKKDLHPRLKKIGAQKTILPDELELGKRPLEKTMFGGVVDNVGGELLAKLIAHVGLWGNVGCIGMAGSYELPTTVFPMILRGVSLLGISSNNTPRPLRDQLWGKLASDWRPDDLESFVYSTVELKDVTQACEKFFNREVNSRIIVELDSTKTV